MFFRICKITLLFLAISSFSAAAQSNDEKRQREEYEQKAKEDLDERIQTFLVDLQADDFQKEIINQKLHSYFQELKKIYLNSSLKYFERDEQIKMLPESHFSDIKNILTDDTMQKIQSFLKDGGVELKKEKKKNNRKNRKKKD